MRSIDIPELMGEKTIRDEEMRANTLKTCRAIRWVCWLLVPILLGFIIMSGSELMNVLSVPMGIVLWTTVIVFCLKGIVNSLENQGVPRAAGTFLSFVVLILGALLLFWAIFSPVLGFGDQVVLLFQQVPGYVAAAQNAYNGFYEQYSYLLQDDNINKWVNEAFAALAAFANSTVQNSAKGAVDITAGIGTSFMVIGFSLVVSYWVLMELPAMGREVRRLVPDRFHEDLNAIYLICTRVMGGYIQGTLIQCAIIGVLAGVGFQIMGLPSAAVLGVITGLLNIIPVVGPWFGGALAAIVGVFVSPVIAIVALVYTIIVQQVIYTFVSPKVLGDACNVHPALVIVALVAGSALGGAASGLMGSFVGALLSIPLVAAGKSVFVYYFEKTTGRTIVAPDGVLFKGETLGEATTPIGDATGQFSAEEVLTVLTDKPKD
ncbi:MAG: AI-2E family transporter [Coriobacteriia bacterium]|nr:AI-2E family transporter [Coriobacteriia bacterium]